MACQSKISGLFLFLAVAWLLAAQRKRLEIFAYLCIFSVPATMWLARNYLVFDNPFYPVLNNVFGGRYYRWVANAAIYQKGLSYFNDNLWNHLMRVFVGYWMSFPFLIASIYEFIKRKRYEFLFVCVAYAGLKEVYMFTPTLSNIRYYYFLLGVCLVYAVLGIQRLKSRLFLSGLILLALGGLFLLPVTDSTSDFISIFEHKLAVVGIIAKYIQVYWWLVLLPIALSAYRLSRRNCAKIFLIAVYCLYFLHVLFIANKSWLNTWLFVLAALALFIGFAWLKIGHCRLLMVGLIIICLLVNSWGMAIIYYWHQGDWTLPVPHIWKTTAWSRSVLDQLTEPGDRSNYYILLLPNQAEYYNWWTAYKATDFLIAPRFWVVLDGYRPNMSPTELKQFLMKCKVKYLIKTGDAFDYEDLSNTEFKRLTELLLAYPQEFLLLANDGQQHYIWQVY